MRSVIELTKYALRWASLLSRLKLSTSASSYQQVLTSMDSMRSVEITITGAQNLLGAIIFISYIFAALLITGWIVFTLGRLFAPLSLRLDRENIQQICAFAVHATIIFGILSYQMLYFLIASYKDWRAARGLPPVLNLSIWNFDQLYLWEWTKTSTLFLDFARKICTEANGNWWWTEHALILSMAWNVYMAVEGKKKKTLVSRTVRVSSSMRAWGMLRTRTM